MPKTSIPSAATSAMRDNIVRQEDSPVLFDYVKVTRADGIKTDVWYCNRHIPDLQQHTHATAIRRYAVPSHSAYLAVAEIGPEFDSTSLPHNIPALPASVAHHERFIGKPLGTCRRRDARPDAIESSFVYPALLAPGHEDLDALGTWYEQEHLPILLSCPQWIMTRRFEITQAVGSAHTHLALHYLSDLRALESSARDQARDTPWRDQMIAEGWFKPEYRVCYRTHAE